MNDLVERQREALVRTYPNSPTSRYLRDKDIINCFDSSEEAGHLPLVDQEGERFFIRRPVARASDIGGGPRKVTLKGLEKCLRRYGWNDWKPVSTGRKTRESFTGRAKRKASLMQVQLSPVARTRFSGMERGKFVHNQSDAWVKMTKEEYVESDFSGRLHPFTAALFDAIIREKLVVIDSEVTVWDPVNERIASRADKLCSSVDGSMLYVVEIKTGFDRCFYKARNNDVVKGTNLPNSPYNHAKLQAALTTYLFSLAYNIPLIRCRPVVIQVDMKEAPDIKYVSHDFIVNEAIPFYRQVCAALL